MANRNLILAAAGVGGGAGAYIEDVFSTYLYTGNGSTQTITNGIDLDGEGGLVWAKNRGATASHYLCDTERGVTKNLLTNSTNAESTASGLTAFNSDGFSIGSHLSFNVSGGTYASWTFRKAPKFFDVVTWTGNGTNPRQIAHNLGSVPGCIIIKSTTRAENWTVYHASLGNTGRLALNTTDVAVTGTSIWASTSPTDTHFTVSADNLVNFSGAGYVAYLFAHDAGGFGDDGEQNVISCGSYTGNGSTTGPVVTLGWEPQWILVKAATTTQGWILMDSMRALNVTSSGDTIRGLRAEASDAEFGTRAIIPTATGFQPVTTAALFNASGQTYIYIAIRRGPMKTPTSGTEVFSLVADSSLQTNDIATAGFPVDMDIGFYRDGSIYSQLVFDRLRGGKFLYTSSTAAEIAYPLGWDIQNGIKYGSASGENFLSAMFRRAPGFFDVVCYTGTGVARTVDHNLGVAPEMMIVKNRGTTGSWEVYSSALGATKLVRLNSDGSELTVTGTWNNTAPTSTVFTVGTASNTNLSGGTLVAYLFATLAGVSKVGSYTGTGTTQQIDCGFSTGARFVLIKRTDSTGDWYVWDSARGISASSDPYILLNSTAAEVTGTDYIDPLASGFEISSSAPAAINASGGNFVFLAVA